MGGIREKGGAVRKWSFAAILKVVGFLCGLNKLAEFLSLGKEDELSIAADNLQYGLILQRATKQSSLGLSDKM